MYACFAYHPQMVIYELWTEHFAFATITQYGMKFNINIYNDDDESNKQKKVTAMAVDDQKQYEDQ